jgi:hypothetical protein
MMITVTRMDKSFFLTQYENKQGETVWQVECKPNKEKTYSIVTGLTEREMLEELQQML